MVSDARQQRSIQRSRGEGCFRRRKQAPETFSGTVDRITFGPDEYQWHQDGVEGHADPDGPPSKSAVTGGADVLYQLPKASITVLRGKIGE